MNLDSIITPSNITLAVLLVSAVFFMRGKVRSDIVAMFSMLALLLSGILTPSEALAGFSSPVVIMMVGLFVVGAGIFRTGLAKMISSKILGIGGKNESLLFVLVMLSTAFVGAFVSNTGTVAVMMPIVMAMVASAGINPRRYLMPMAFASSMGTFTLISTPPNLVIQEALIDGGFKPLGFFSFAPVGAIAVSVGVVLLFFLSKLLVKKDEGAGKAEKKSKTIEELVSEYNITQQTFLISVPAGSQIAGKPLAELNIGSVYQIRIGRVLHQAGSRFRKSQAQEIAGPKTVIREGDMLYCHGLKDNIERFIEENGLNLEKQSRERSNAHSGEHGIAEVYVMPNSILINKTIIEARFRELYNVNVLGIKRQGEEYSNRNIKDIRMLSGDALLIEGTWDDITAMDEHENDFVLVGQPGKEAAKVTLDRKAPVAAAIMLGMILVMVLDIVPAVAAVLMAAMLMVVTGCLRNMEEAYSNINWSSIVLIAAMIPMSTAFDKTGITASISNFLLTGLGDIGPMGLMAAIYASTTIITMFLSNTATAVLFTPIAMSAATTMGVSPYPFLFAVAVAAGMCFASPFSTPPNALVMSAGNYKFSDYIKVGLPTQLIMGVVMIFMLPLLFPF